MLALYRARDPDCTPHAFAAGSGFVDKGGDVHVVLNDRAVFIDCYAAAGWSTSGAGVWRVRRPWLATRTAPTTSQHAAPNAKPYTWPLAPQPTAGLRIDVLALRLVSPSDSNREPAD
jgi:hypothetical protein